MVYAQRVACSLFDKPKVCGGPSIIVREEKEGPETKRARVKGPGEDNWGSIGRESALDNDNKGDMAIERGVSLETTEQQQQHAQRNEKSKERNKREREEARLAATVPSLWLGLSRTEADAVATRLKQLSGDYTKMVALQRRMASFSREGPSLLARGGSSSSSSSALPASASGAAIAWKVTVEAAPLPIREISQAGDVPQAPWLLGDRSMGVSSGFASSEKEGEWRRAMMPGGWWWWC